ncbi:helix-turn-helix transcriptional regulator [Candidatus Magnetominusculus dajiuhuensis]|uniref:helix-turn-helix transcriptional regulator n=1 Tax=Candidatus Magnetominusculus dajiuhuensis TaxID=3137712 RepID=UPI003B433409
MSGIEGIEGIQGIGGIQDVVNAPKTNPAPITPKKTEAEAPAHQTTTTSASGGTTVHLSNAAQALELQQEGYSAEQIARKLGISIITVNGYLASETNTTTAAAATTPKASGTT